MHGEMLERFPFAPELDTPLELTQLVGEIVSCDAFTGKLYFGTGLVGCAQVTLVHMSGEVAFQQIGEVRTCRYYPALADAVVGKDGNGEVGVLHFGFDSTRPKTCQLSAVGIDDFHTVVLYGGFGSHVLVLQPQSQGKSPLFLFVEPLGGITFDSNGDARCVAVYLAYLLGQGNGRCTADIESGFNVVFPTVQIGVDKTFVSLFLCLYVGYHCQQYGYRANKMMLFHIL